MDTELKANENYAPESLTHAVARRFREQLAGRNLTRREVARLLNRSEPWVGRRASGQTPFTTDDLSDIERVTGISAVYLVSGIKNSRRQEIPSDGLAVHPPGLEHGTH